VPKTKKEGTREDGERTVVRDGVGAAKAASHLHDVPVDVHREEIRHGEGLVRDRALERAPEVDDLAPLIARERVGALVRQGAADNRPGVVLHAHARERTRQFSASPPTSKVPLTTQHALLTSSWSTWAEPAVGLALAAGGAPFSTLCCCVWVCCTSWTEAARMTEFHGRTHTVSPVEADSSSSNSRHDSAR